LLYVADGVSRHVKYFCEGLKIIRASNLQGQNRHRIHLEMPSRLGCDDRADWTKAGWFIFCMLMIAFLAKDMIGGCKLTYHSSKIRHKLGARIRYLIAGTSLCSITVFALYVS